MISLLTVVTSLTMGWPTNMMTRFFLYHPTQTELQPLAHGTWEIQQVEVEDGQRLVGLVRPASLADAPWILFFGGNAMGLDAGQAVLGITAGKAGWGLVAFAYRGYDGSSGEPSEAALLADARSIVAHLAIAWGVEPARLILMGQSLGTGVVVDLAVHLTRRGTPPAAVVLLSPFLSMVQVFDDHVPLIPMRWLVSDRYPTDQIAGELLGPVLLIHGEDDTLITIDHSHRLLQILTNRAQLISLPGRGHNDLWEDRRTVLAIRELIARAVHNRGEPAP